MSIIVPIRLFLVEKTVVPTGYGFNVMVFEMFDLSSSVISQKCP